MNAVPPMLEADLVGFVFDGEVGADGLCYCGGRLRRLH